MNRLNGSSNQNTIILDRPELADRILNFNCGPHVTQRDSGSDKIGFVLRSFKVPQDPARTTVPIASTSEWHCDHECKLPSHFLRVVEWPADKLCDARLAGYSP